MLKIYNTLFRKKQIFKPLKNNKVGIYTCGPTVYDFAHIGNLRACIISDLLKRCLKYKKFKVKHIMNITDVDDKTIRASQKKDQSLKKITGFYLNAFLKDLKKINIQSPDIMPRATEHIPEMINLIKRLEKKGYAYQTNNSVYYKIARFRNYGKLAQLDKQKLRTGASQRIDNQEYEKEEVADFVLWKAWTEKDGNVYWKSPWGKGRPGWHIECSAMSMKYLGDHFDIHCGADELIFPHHTNEIAQSEAATEKKFVNYWFHHALVLVNDQKMAKSLNNCYSLKDIVIKGFNPLSYRYLCLIAHYRSKLNFTWQALKAAQNGLNNLYEKTAQIKSLPLKIQTFKTKIYQKKFLDLIDNDLDTAKALALMWQMINDKNLSNREKYALLLNFDKVFGLNLAKIKKLKIPQEIKKLINLRKKYRQANDWKKADKIRKIIQSKGYKIEDTLEKPKIKKLL